MGNDDDVRDALEGAAEKRMRNEAQRTKLLGDQIESLDRMSSDVMERWTSANDFARVDLVCAELLKRGSFVDALKYMERCEQVTRLICQKLRPAAAREMAGVDPVDGDDIVGGGGVGAGTVRFANGADGGGGGGDENKG
eukprot:CAMPEP_0197612816 /NCGR_PEP_ID=MMETSP1326-20131121/58011_1 /TAXON_ID=1155430 /ORGANISM="Genus nov. species nov., Strain RCC2288" /LENGTH=138 /DNA_ID=CAMNT_0043181617 /DNA_START=249 /DNA_END=661 /DNA_ORIENTATION=+